MSVVGARPQFVKLAPVAGAIAAYGHEHRIVHTGQHYDPMLSEVFFRDLRIPDPDVHLGVGSGSHGAQTGSMLAQLEEVFRRLSPDCVLVYGDTNSTLAAAVSAVKLQLPLAHLEAGLRSFNRRMPEEHNRVLTDHAADLCLAPTPLAMRQLEREGLSARSVLVGDVMTEILFSVRDRVRSGEISNPLLSEYPAGGYYLATIHRAENTDDSGRLSALCRALGAADKPVVLLAHPRLQAKAVEHGIELSQGALRPVAPLPYPQLVAAALDAAGIVTDSGGLQKEAFLLRVPCTTVREETEWVETIELGWNVLASTESDILAALSRATPADTQQQPYGAGDAADRAVQAMMERLSA